MNNLNNLKKEIEIVENGLYNKLMGLLDIVHNLVDEEVCNMVGIESYFMADYVKFLNLPYELDTIYCHIAGIFYSYNEVYNELDNLNKKELEALKVTIELGIDNIEEIKDELLDYIKDETEKEYNLIFKDTEYIEDYIDYQYEYESFIDESLEDYSNNIEAIIYETEILFYNVAMNFLLENDPSLTEAFNIASEYCFELNQLNSELLASLLLQSYLIDEFYGISEQLKELKDNYNNKLELIEGL